MSHPEPPPPHHRAAKAAAAPAPDTLTPADRYQELFTAVQGGGVFADSKTFVDCAPRAEPEAIVAAYRQQCHAADFDLARFVHAHFRSIEPEPTDYVSVPGQPIARHIESLWSVLTRHPSAHPPRSSLLQLPHPYIVPGGRFGELYYWDAYFTMVGLAGQRALRLEMVDNFAYLIDTYGHVPNGTRTYYLGRSQPPVFALMVELAEGDGDNAAGRLPQLRREHAWWMAGEQDVAPGAALRRVVRVADGRILNRYWDDRDTPREEAWIEDVATARASGRAPADVYRDLRAACESGWDFSTRWLAEGATPAAPAAGHRRAQSAPSLASICTTDIVPVDLNALLYKLECKIAELSARDGAGADWSEFEQRARARKAAALDLLWNAREGAFFDHDWRRGEQRRCLTAACVVPLFVGLADGEHASALATTIRARLLEHGGLATTERASDQQWDRPNGWAPLQWMAIRGLAAYGHDALADSIAKRWLATVAAIYEREGKLVEKYALRRVAQDATHGGGGGEYPLQDGFGWTNGVTAALLARQPGHSAQASLAHAASARHR